MNRPFAFIAIALLLSLGTGCVKVEKESNHQPEVVQRAAATHAVATVHAEKPTILPLPKGLKGLSFGMTPEQVRKAMELPHDHGAEQNSSGMREIELRFRFHRVNALKSGPEIPGPSFMAQTTIGPEKAVCQFEFAVEGGLSRMACQLAPHESAENHRAALDKILDTLRRKYGPPRDSSGTKPDPYAPAGYYQGPRSWTWRDGGAGLRLESDLSPMMPRFARLCLINESAQHLAIAEQIEQEKKRKERETQLARERAKQEELRRLEEHQRAFDRDL